MARAVVAIEIAARTPKLSARGWNMAATSILVAPELLARNPAADVKPWSKRAGSVSCLYFGHTAAVSVGGIHDVVAVCVLYL